MGLSTRISAFFETLSGSALMFNQSFIASDGASTQYYRNPISLTINPLATVVVDLFGVIITTFLMIESNVPIDVTIITPTGPIGGTTPTSATFKVNGALLLSANITQLTIFNPQGGTTGASVKIASVGT